jgi:hypothetical protein
MTRLAGHGRPEQPAGGHRATSGIVVDRLLAPGTPWSRSPQQLQRRPTPLGRVKAHSDPGDRCKLAEDLRTDSHRLRRLQPTDAAT